MITKDMLIGDIIKEYPITVNTLIACGMQCLGCPSSQMESLENACFVHGLNPDAVLLALNNTIGE